MALLKATEQDKKKTAGGIAENGILLCPTKKKLRNEGNIPEQHSTALKIRNRHSRQRREGRL